MGNCITEKISHEFVSSSGFTVGVSGMQGWRQEMEDAHISVDVPSLPSHTFLAVFDGHGGAGAAKFAEHHMVPVFEGTQSWKDYVAGGANDLELLKKALLDAFQLVDERLREEQESGSSGQDSSGCTANVVVITPKYIVCANLGDSRSVLSNKKAIEGLSVDHKPYDEAEKQRIEKAGGTVHMKRVDGDLAVSRTLGDFTYKVKGGIPGEQKVSSVPEIKVKERQPNDEFVLIGCDGVWDVMSNEDAANAIRGLYQKGERSAKMIAEEMCDLALEKGSRDNISAVVAQFPAVDIGNGNGVRGLREARAAADKNKSRLPGSLDGDEHSG